MNTCHACQCAVPPLMPLILLQKCLNKQADVTIPITHNAKLMLSLLKKTPHHFCFLIQPLSKSSVLKCYTFFTFHTYTHTTCIHTHTVRQTTLIYFPEELNVFSRSFMSWL